MVRRSLLLALVVLTVVGCSSAPLSAAATPAETLTPAAPPTFTPPTVTPAPSTQPTSAAVATPHPQWSLADAQACWNRSSAYSGYSTAGMGSAWDSLKYYYAPDVRQQRRNALSTVQYVLKAVAAGSRPPIIPVALETAAISELKHAEKVLQQPMTEPQFLGLVDDIEVAMKPVIAYCTEVGNWVQQNVPG
jgi:hypothetical protein